MPRARARAASTSRSPRITSRPGNSRRAAHAHRSGPMPAGSPAVRATRVSDRGTAVALPRASALVVAVLDERAVALLAQPVLVRLVRLACADGLARGRLAPLLG